MRIIKTEAGTRVKWPLPKMKLGDFAIVKDKWNFLSARSVAVYYGRTLNRRYSVRTVKSGLKITRVA